MNTLAEQIRRLADAAASAHLEPATDPPQRRRSRRERFAIVAVVSLIVAGGIIGVSATLTNRNDDVASATTIEPPADRAYRVLEAHLAISQNEATLDVGSQHGVQPGVGVYREGLIGVVDETQAASSTVRLLGAAGLEIRAAVTYPDAIAEDRSGFSTIEGTVRTTTRGQVVFTPDESLPNEEELVVGEIVAVAGGPGTLLQGKTEIGIIARPITTDGSTSYLVRLSGTRTDGEVLIFLREA